MTTEFIDVPRSFLRLLGIDIGVEKFKTGNTVALSTKPFNFDRVPINLVQRGQDLLSRQNIEILFPHFNEDIQQPDFANWEPHYKYQRLFVWFRPILLEDAGNWSWITPEDNETALEYYRELSLERGEKIDRLLAIVEWRVWVEYNMMSSMHPHHFEFAQSAYKATETQLEIVFPEPDLSWSLPCRLGEDNPRWRYNREIVWLNGTVDWNKAKHCVQDAVHRTSNPVDLAGVAAHLDVDLQKALKREEESPIFNRRSEEIGCGETRE